MSDSALTKKKKTTDMDTSNLLTDIAPVECSLPAYVSLVATKQHRQNRLKTGSWQHISLNKKIVTSWQQ